MRRTTRSLALLLCLIAGRALAQAPIDIEKDFAPGTNTRFAELVGKGQQSIYAAVLAAYDARLAKYPDEVTVHIERCRFIETFAYSEDMVIESSNDDLEACREKLGQGPHAKNVDVILYGVESGWDEEKSAEAQALIPYARVWTKNQQATLYELLTDRFQLRDEELAAQYAIRAVSLKPGSRVLLIAAARLIQIGAKDKARRLLLDAPPETWESASRFNAAKLLIDLGEPQAAAALMSGEKEKFANSMLADVLVKTGQIKEAREMYRATLDNEYAAYEDRAEYFEFELDHGTREEAIAAYDQLRDQGFGADILGRQRLSLLLAHPAAPWQGRDFLGLLMLLGVLLAFALVPLVVIAPVHYRGLARRVAGLAPSISAPVWTLRHAWYALAALVVASVISSYVFLPEWLELMLPWSKRTTAEDTDIELGKEMLVAAVLTFALLLPLLRGRPWKSLLLGNWPIVKSVLVGIGLGIALKILSAVIGVGIQSLGGALGTDTIRAVQGAHQSFGLVGMLLMIALAVPLVEEFVFRGVLLEAFRAEITFAFAVILQAVVFAAIHESWADLPGIFVFALVAGWLTKRSEGLVAAIALHSTFNLISALTIVGVTSALNR